MEANQEHKWRDITLKSLEAGLRSLPELDVPKGLEAKLLAAIPQGGAAGAVRQKMRWWPEVLSVCAVAAVLIFSVLVVQNYGPSIHSQPVISDLNDRAVLVMADQNKARVGDTNYTGDQSNR